MTSSLKSKAAEAQSPVEIGKWLLIVVFLAAVVTANCYFVGQSAVLKMAGNLVAALIAFSLFAFTAQGRRFMLFVRDARMELRRVVWPSKQETIHSTLIIVVVVIVTAVFLWGVDNILLWAIGFFTGQRG